MTPLINLLSWQPGHSGFGSYVQRVVPGTWYSPAARCAGKGLFDSFRPVDDAAASLGTRRLTRLLQRNAVVQHGQRLRRLLNRAALCPEVIYSPFFDALLSFLRFLS